MAVTLGLLFYLSTVTLSQFITVILVVFCSVILLLVNLLLLYGNDRGKAHLLLPWLAITLPATLALLVYTSAQFHQLAPYQAVYLGAVLLSTYFCSVVVTQVHRLRRLAAGKKPVLEDGEGEARPDTTLPSEDTVLVELAHGLPQPEEVISVDQIKLTANNPFLEDVFKVKVMQKAAKQTISSGSMDIRADFTPYKPKDEAAGREGEEGGEAAAKLRIFLPQTGEGEDSDFDFSFTDPVFDSSLVAASHPEHTGDE